MPSFVKTQKNIVVFLFCAIFFAGALFAAGCKKEEAQTAADPGGKSEIIVGVELEPNKINPFFNDDHDDAIFLIFSGLVRFDEKNEPVPDLAQSWEVSEDLLTYTFKLNKNAKWHDGKPFTAEDVKFTIEAALDEKNNSEIKYRFEEFKTIEVIDPHTLKIVLKTPFQPIFRSLATGMLPKHLLEGKDINTAEFNSKPVGTGRYKFADWKKGQYLLLAANTDFYLGAPKNGQVVLKFIADPNVKAVQLETGEIDAALIDPVQAERIAKNANLTVTRVKTADYRALMYNRKFPLWSDVRVRQALNYAVNREALVQGLLLGWGKPAYGPLELNWANNPDVPNYAYDPAKAKALLAEAGYQPGPDGILQKDGQKLSFKITAFNYDPVRIGLASELSTQFKQIGVEAVPDLRERGSFNLGDVETFLLGWGSPFDPDDDTYRIFHSSQIGKLNYENYQNAKVDELLLKARQAANRGDRLKLYQEFQKELAADPAFNFLVYLDQALVSSKKVAGIKLKVLGHHGAGYIWNIEEWTKK
ncbi:MAG: ABC transporter substrate-binding protein [Sporomusaceae bacterium]|jgi:peptide/nickel transport system substrate-binding protein|nr:ABC transporter substrate-binding protein [Sporomusaceae bacterium]